MINKCCVGQTKVYDDDSSTGVAECELELSKVIFDDFAISDGHLDYFGVHVQCTQVAGSHDVLLLQNSPTGERIACGYQGDFVRSLQHRMFAKNIPGNSPNDLGGLHGVYIGFVWF